MCQMFYDWCRFQLLCNKVIPCHTFTYLQSLFTSLFSRDYRGITSKHFDICRSLLLRQSIFKYIYIWLFCSLCIYVSGKSVYFDESGSPVPYYRSKSVDRISSYSLTHEPIVNEHDVIYLTYVGTTSRPTSAESRKSRARSRSRRGSGIIQKRVETVPPHRRNSFNFDELHHRINEQIHDTYGRADVDVKQKEFFQTLALIQLEHNKMKRLNMSKSDRKFLEKTFEQVKNLKSETNKVLKDANKKYESQFESQSPNREIHRLTKRKPLDDVFLQRQRTRGRLKLKPLGGNRNLDVDRVVSHDFYTRRKNSDWRYDMHKQQSRQYFKFGKSTFSLEKTN